jgi:hypothetical protein
MNRISIPCTSIAVATAAMFGVACADAGALSNGHAGGRP